MLIKCLETAPTSIWNTLNNWRESFHRVNSIVEDAIACSISGASIKLHKVVSWWSLLHQLITHYMQSSKQSMLHRYTVEFHRYRKIVTDCQKLQCLTVNTGTIIIIQLSAVYMWLLFIWLFYWSLLILLCRHIVHVQ